MAKLEGLLKLRGSVGELTFTAGAKGETYVKQKSRPGSLQLKEGEAFARSRRAGAEFKLATKATKLFREAMGTVKKAVGDRFMTGRMHAWFLSGVETDITNEWGERRVQDSDLNLLEGFEFNSNLGLEELLPLNPVNCFQVDDRLLRISIPGFRLRRNKKYVPVTATHFQVVSTIIYIDFTGQSHSVIREASVLTNIGRKSGRDFAAEHAVNPRMGQLCFWLLGVELYSMEKDKPVVVRGGVLRCMKVWGAELLDALE